MPPAGSLEVRQNCSARTSRKIASAQAWIYQTWLALSKAGCAVNLTHAIPEEGVLVTLAGCLRPTFRPTPEVFFADIVADGVPHPAAHLHIVQNSIHAQKLPRSIFMPHWPHPNLLPRDSARGDRFETLGFFGDAENLAPELHDAGWQARLLDQTGITLRVVGAKEWHDYREIDCVLAVREFGNRAFLRKPATKMYNAWLARVPFVGGRDSAYCGDASRGGNISPWYSLVELNVQLNRLRTDLRFRKELVTAGLRKSKQFDRSAILERWRELIENTLPEAAAGWTRKSAIERRVLSIAQENDVWLDRRWRN